MSEKLRLSTSNIEPHCRLDFWRATLADSYTRCEIRDCDPEGFDCEMEATQVGMLSLTHVESVPQTFARPQSIIKSGDRDDYVAAIQLKTGIRCSLNGRESVTSGGSITLYDMGQPFVCQSADRCSSLDIHIPRDVFERVLGPAPKAVGLTITPDLPSGPVLNAFFRSLMERGHLFDPVMADRMSAIGVDLIAAGFADQLAHEPRTGVGSATFVYRAKVFIEDRLWDAALDTATIAAALNLSVRRLQEVFAEQDLTVDGYLWERRLAKACLQLRDPAYGAVPVSSIGYGVGFISASHFARRFRQRFAMSPSEYREKARFGAVH